MAIQLVSFGGLRVVNDTGELPRLLTQHSRAALFVYLVVERRVSREALAAMFWPESDAEQARHALRQSLYHLRKAVGEDWIDSRAHELVVGDHVHGDVHDFTQALERGDAESAVGSYQGPFLDGVHLVDLRSWESWVDSRRAQYARAFRKACRDLIDSRRAAGDLSGAIEIAELWTSRDHTDDEAQHRLIESLGDAGERAEALRQYDTYARMLESDGLEPLDETRALAERLRRDPAPLPALRAPALPAAQPVANVVSEPIALGVGGSTGSPLTRPRRLRPRLAAMLLGVGAALGGAAWALQSTLGERSPAPSPAVIAVLPFSVHGAESVRYLGEGVANLLGTALDGTESLRPVDTRATLAAVAAAGANVRDARYGADVAARLGAAMFVLGDVVESGGKVQIDAAVYDVGQPKPRSRTAVSGAADSVFALVDRLAAELLGGLGRPSGDRLIRTAALTTSSLPAFKAYLRGEHQMRAGQFERAADNYLAALALDSTFAVAHYRLALAREWAPLPGEEAAALAAARHGARLSSRDRMLLAAFHHWRAGNADQADRAYREIVARYPDEIEAWFQLGEIRFHHGPLLGHAVEESNDAWRKVLTFEPRNLFALTHVARIAAMQGNGPTLDSLLAQFSPEEQRSDRRLEEVMVLKAMTRGDTAVAFALARHVRGGEALSVWRVAAWLTAFASDPGIMRGVMSELSRDFPDSARGADLHWFESLLELARGRLAAAERARVDASRTERTVVPGRRRSAFDEVTEWFAATLPLPYADSTLDRVRERAASAPSTRPGAAFENELGMGAAIQFEPLRQYTLGTLALRSRDTASAVAAAAKLARLATSRSATALVRDLDRGLRARVAWHEGRPAEALRLLEALESRDAQGDIAVIPFVARANERYLRGQVLAALGRDAEALPWFASLGTGSVTELPLRALSELRQAEIHERLGHSDVAAAHYERFVTLWRDADASLQPMVDSARTRLAIARARRTR